MEEKEKILDEIQQAFLTLTEGFIEQGASVEELKVVSGVSSGEKSNRDNVLRYAYSRRVLLVLFAPVFCGILYKWSQFDVVKNVRGTRCLIPNNYFIWEFTRPISNCDYCRNVEEALILPNLTKEEFKPYAYSSRPIVIKSAARDWPASKVFNWSFFKNLYDSVDGAYESVEECQFLHFKSSFTSLKEVFAMSEDRAMHRKGEESWYVGWKNCHLQVLDVMRQFYKLPDFLPEDAEVPYTNFVFLGYEEGAVMHLDYISRLMWQGQILGNKVWTVAPTPECDNVCKRFNFSVEAGDIVLLDTRIWYHGTYVVGDNISLTVTSEYG